jgi:threonine 3-dehydrogenase
MKTLVDSKAERRRWFKNIPEPAIGINDVLIRVRYTGIGESEGVV